MLLACGHTVDPDEALSLLPLSPTDQQGSKTPLPFHLTHHHQMLPQGFAIFTFLLFVRVSTFLVVSVAKVSIPDDLRDVVDDEEDEAWREWGRKRSPPPPTKFDPPPYDLHEMLPSEVQEDMMTRHVGPSFGIVKLRLGVRRSLDDVTHIATQWSKILRTGSVEATFMVVDLSTIMFTIQKGQDVVELKDFILSQQEAYEVKIGELLFRRPGDPPLDEVVEKLQRERTEANHLKDEL